MTIVAYLNEQKEMQWDNSLYDCDADFCKLIEKYKEKWISSITEQITLEECYEAILPIWKKLFGTIPKITLFPSPKACQSENLKDADEYFSLWTISYAATYELAKENGAIFDEEKLNTFINWAKCCHYIRFNDNEVLVSQYPTILKLDSEERLHCEDGPALMYGDGHQLHAIHGKVFTPTI